MKGRSEKIFLEIFKIRYRKFKEKHSKEYISKIDKELNPWIEKNYTDIFGESKETLEKKSQKLFEKIKKEFPRINTIEEAFIEVKMQNDCDVEFAHELEIHLLEKELEINENIRRLYSDIYRDSNEGTIDISEIEERVVEYYKSAGFDVKNKLDIYFMN